MADAIHKVEPGVRLIAPIAVTFKMSELPVDFQEICISLQISNICVR